MRRTTTTLTLALALTLAACGSSSNHGQASADTTTATRPPTTATTATTASLNAELAFLREVADTVILPERAIETARLTCDALDWPGLTDDEKVDRLIYIVSPAGDDIDFFTTRLTATGRWICPEHADAINEAVRQLRG